MARVRLLERDEAPLGARRLYRDDGTASALTRSLANAPDLLETFMPFLGQIYSTGSVDLATKELVIVRVSQLNACRYCLAAHRPVGARRRRLRSTARGDLRRGARSTALPERERTIVEWVDRVRARPRRRGPTSSSRACSTTCATTSSSSSRVLAGATALLNHYCTAFDIPPPG